jgi:quinol monooxygenase YgiN
MIIGRFKIQCRPEPTDEMAKIIAAVEAPSRDLPGVVHFDVSRSLTDPNAFIATEVFTSREALERQNAQREVAAMLDLINAGALTGEYEWIVWETAE